MQIEVISLTTANTRRASVRNQFKQLGIDFRFFDAICPATALQHIDGYDEQEFVINAGRTATGTEIACYASHLALWRRCAADGVPRLILEDDAALDSAFPAGLLVTAAKIRRLGFVRVSVPELRTSTCVDRLGTFQIHLCRRAPLLALGYAISPAVARRLVLMGRTVEEPVDKFLQRFWRFGNPVYGIVPSIVGLSLHAYNSDIGTRAKADTDFSTWMRRAGRKTHNAVSRTVFSARVLSDARFRPLAYEARAR